MDEAIKKMWANQIIKQLEQKPMFVPVFIPKYKTFPKLCKWMNWGKWEYKNATIKQNGTVNFKRME